MAKESDSVRQMREMTPRLRGLAEMQAALVGAARKIQDTLLFHGHPDVMALDDELDTLYRGQL